MFHHSKEPTTNDDVAHIEATKRRPFLSRLLSKAEERTHEPQAWVDVYRASVETCLVPLDFNEEHPLYLLDLGGVIAILFGQWMYDIHTLTAPEDTFENWHCERAFFQTFSLRCLAARGTVLHLTVEGASFVEAQRLPFPLKFRRLRECEFVNGYGATLRRDLEKAGLIECAR